MERIFKEIEIMQTLIEQRKDSRNSVSWPVSVWIPQANRFVNGRSCNISKTGVFITLPATAPVGTGHLVELNFPRTEALAEEKGQFARIKTGKVVRVERRSLLESAEIGLGIAFE
ncbi:MAG: PilZ domain-containing protein [Phycisphaerales bacterium]|nr:MAG: PilZ domain-containing protein [Phycisphaerales bacterium]